MATNVSKPAGIGTGRARRSEWRSVAYFTLHGFSFAGSTLLMTWGLFFLFFLALGGFSFDGFIHQLNNLTSRYVVADAARTGAFLNMFATAPPSVDAWRRVRGSCQPLALELSHVGDDRPPVRGRDRPAVPGHQP